MQGLHENIIELIFILLHFIVFVLNYEVMKRKLMQPAVLFSLVWFIILLSHFLFRLTLLNELATLHTSTFFIFFIGVVSFSFGNFLQTTIWQKNHFNGKIVQFQEVISISLALRFFLLAIILIVLPFYIKASYQMFIASQVESFIVGLRTEVLYGEDEIGSWKYVSTLSYITFGISLIAYYKNRSRLNLLLLFLTFILSIAYAILATGRLLYLILLAIYTGVSFIYNKNFSIKRIMKLVGIFMLFFIFMGVLYGKGGDTESSLKENIKPAAEATAIYLVSPLNALDYDLNHQFEISNSGGYTLRFFVKLAQRLGLMPQAKVTDVVQQFVMIPYPTNVYTFYYKYIKDFGRGYAWIMLFLFGLLHSYLYNKAGTTKSIRFTLYYALMLFPLIISFFDDEYMFLISMWLQIIFLIEILLIFNRFVMKDAEKTKRKVEVAKTRILMS